MHRWEISNLLSASHLDSCSDVCIVPSLRSLSSCAFSSRGIRFIFHVFGGSGRNGTRFGCPAGPVFFAAFFFIPALTSICAGGPRRRGAGSCTLLRRRQGR